MWKDWAQYLSEVDDIIDSVNVSSALDTPKDLKWKVPAARVLYPKVGVSGDLDLRSPYTAL